MICKPAFMVLLLFVFCTVARAGQIEEGFRAYEASDYETAFKLLSPLATDANPELLNFVGFMLYYGQGHNKEPEVAHELFHRAAEFDVADAQQNLGILHSQGARGVPVDYEEAVHWFTKVSQSRLDKKHPSADRPGLQLPNQFNTVLRTDGGSTDEGKDVFLTFCGGCHGFNGFAFFPIAPSFAMGERIKKSDSELLNSILKGKNSMPSWEDKLSRSSLKNALKYLRTLAIQSGFGTLPIDDVEVPGMYFIFNPPGSAPDSNNWYQEIYE